MLYDLNLAWTPGSDVARLGQTLALAASLGYGTVALNHTLELPLPAKPTPPFPDRLALQGHLGPDDAAAAAGAGAKLPHVLRRATLLLADPAAPGCCRLPALAAAYDVLAVRPLTERAFQSACLALDVAVVSLDLTAHFPFHFRPRPCMAAVARGVRFEICYAQLLAADARGRANFIANLAALVRATRGRGLLVSSEARAPLGLRAPADVVNLLSVWGLAADRGLEGFRAVARAVVVNEGIRRSGFRGVVDVVQVAVAVPDAPARPEADSARAQKRKPGGDGAAQPTSKRQAKKMKLAALATST